MPQASRGLLQTPWLSDANHPSPHPAADTGICVNLQIHVSHPDRRRNHGLIDYARGKFAAERYPFAPALRPIRETLAKLDPKPKAEPSAPKKPYVPSLVLNKGKRRR